MRDNNIGLLVEGLILSPRIQLKYERKFLDGRAEIHGRIIDKLLQPLQILISYSLCPSFIVCICSEFFIVCSNVATICTLLERSRRSRQE